MKVSVQGAKIPPQEIHNLVDSMLKSGLTFEEIKATVETLGCKVETE